jgi:hypothetical protein
VSQSQGEEVYSENLWLVPMTPELISHFAERAPQALSRGFWEMTVGPGESTRLGIYAVGPKAEQLMLNGHSASAFSTGQAPTSCHAWCGDQVAGYHFDGYATAFAYWQARGWPGGSRTCENLRPWASNGAVWELHYAEANECAAWDLSVSSNPLDPRRYCRRENSTSEPWQLSRTFAPVTEGTRTSPVILTVLPASRKVEVRYEFSNGPAREISNVVLSQYGVFQ